MGGDLALGLGGQTIISLPYRPQCSFFHPKLQMPFFSSFIIWNVLCLKYRNTVTDPSEADHNI